MSHAGPPPQGPQGPHGPQGPAPAPPPGYRPQGPQGPADGVWTIHPQEPTPPPKRRKAPAIIAISVAVALVAGGGGFAFVQADPFNLFGAGPQAAEALPSTSVAYFGLDLDPSAAQKVDAIRFLNHFPEFRDKVDIRNDRDDVREDLISDALEQLDCKGVSYDETIKPWLGYKFGMGLLPGDGDEPDPVFAVEVTDAGAADAALDDLNACAPTEQGVGFAFSGDYVLLAETRDIAKQAADAAADASLADQADFKADLDSLGELGIATGWVDLDAAKALVPKGELSDDDLAAMTATAGRAAATFRFNKDSVEVASSTFGDFADIDHGDNEIVGLPDSTAFAVSESGGGKRLEASWGDILERAKDSGVDIEQQIEDFEAETGFALPADVQTLLGDNLLLAVDADGISAADLEAGDVSQLDAGARFTGDAADLQDLYGRITSMARDSFGVDLPVSEQDFEDGLAIATTDEYADKLSRLDGDLGAADNFTSVIDDAASKEFVLYVDFDSIEDVVVDAMKSGGASADEVDNVVPLRAFGISVDVDGDYAHATMRLSVND